MRWELSWFICLLTFEMTFLKFLSTILSLGHPFFEMNAQLLVEYQPAPLIFHQIAMVIEWPFFLNVSFNFRWLFYRNLSFVYYAFIFWMILIKYKVLVKMFYNNSFNITEVIILKIWMFFKRVWLVMFYLLNDFEIWSLVKLFFIRFRLL